MNIPLEYLSDEILDILQQMAHDQRATLSIQIEAITAERVRRGGAPNQMSMPWGDDDEM